MLKVKFPGVPVEFMAQFKISYHLFMLPHDYFNASKSWFFTGLHKSLCVLLSLGSCCWFFYSCSKMIIISPTNPMSYFDSFCVFLLLVQRALLLKLIWFNPDKIVSIFSTLQRVPASLCIPVSYLTKLKYSSFVACTHLIMFVSETWFVFKTLDIKYMKSILSLIACAHDSLFNAFTCTCIPLFATSLRNSVIAFTKYLDSTRQLRKIHGSANVWLEIEKQLHFLETLCDRINDMLGHLYTVFILVSVLFLSSAIHLVATTATQATKFGTTLESLFLLIAICMNLYISADIPFKMETLKKWLAKKENHELISSQRELMILLNQLDSNFISLKASGYFSLTFGLVATVRIFLVLPSI